MSAVRTLLLLLVSLTAVSVQAPPDFSGKWAAEGAPAGDMGSGWGPAITVTQDASRLTVEYAFFGRGDMQPPLRFVYALDGSETKSTVMMGRGMQDQTSRAAWQGSALAITTIHPFTDPQTGKPAAVEVKRTLTLDGGSLVVETVRSGVLGGPPSTSRTIYKKQP